MAVLITGGMGFVGLHAARCFLDAGSRVLLTRYRTWRAPDILAAELGGDHLAVEQVDLADGWALLEVVRRYGVRSLLHLAGPPLDTPPAAAYTAALTGLINVLEAARQQGLERVTVASSIAVYAGAGPGPWREEQPLPAASGNQVGAIKKAVEALALDYGSHTGLDVRVIRLAGIYGPLYHSMANLPSRLCHAAVAGQQPDLRDVRPAADLCYVKDAAAGIQRLHAATRLHYPIYNLGSGRAATTQELVAAVARAAPEAHFELHAEDPPAAGWMDISRAQRDADYKPGYDLDAGVADYIAWLKGHTE